jgi:hypothetical protein
MPIRLERRDEDKMTKSRGPQKISGRHGGWEESPAPSGSVKGALAATTAAQSSPLKRLPQRSGAQTMGNKKPADLSISGFSYMAQRTGLEPATPGVTGRYSNRLNYRCVSAGLASKELFFKKAVLHLMAPLEVCHLSPSMLELEKNGAADGTRTRDPRRDRPVF